MLMYAYSSFNCVTYRFAGVYDDESDGDGDEGTQMGTQQGNRAPDLPLATQLRGLVFCYHH